MIQLSPSTFHFIRFDHQLFSFQTNQNIILHTDTVHTIPLSLMDSHLIPPSTQSQPSFNQTIHIRVIIIKPFFTLQPSSSLVCQLIQSPIRLS